MIISFQCRFIFVAIPKSATHSIRTALRLYMGVHDWEQCDLFEKKAFPVPDLAKVGHGHLTCRQVRPFLLPQLWSDHFGFCFVRNPYARFVSSCYFLNRKNRDMQTDPLATMKRMIRSRNDTSHVLLRPQFEFVTDDQMNLMVDYVGRFETLQRDFDQVCRRVGLPQTTLTKINAFATARYPTCYDLELKEQVENFYREDFALFDYPLELETIAFDDCSSAEA